MDPILPRTPAFHAISRALFAAGLATFAMLYCVQPLMPVLAREFALTAAQSSLSLSVTTGVLAPMLLVSSALSDAVGRKPMIVGGILASAALTLASAAAPGWPALLACRLAMGLSLSAIQSVAMAYLGEEVAAVAIGGAMGLFISGSSIGGLVGRIFAGFATGATSWRAAMAAIGVLSVIAGIYVLRALPPSRFFVRRPLRPRAILGGIVTHLSDRRLLALYAIGMLNMGGFVAAYNLIGFRLLAPPYDLPQAVVAGIFVLYLVGTASSAWMGAVADRLGRARALILCLSIALAGLLLTASAPLALVILGIAVLTFGFFATHSIASGWVSRHARVARAQATGLYLFAFYLGSSGLASLAGLAWPGFGWSGIVVVGAAFQLAALAVALMLARTGDTPR